MTSVKFPAIVLVVVALLSSGLAASGFENSGIGTTATGMAGAFRAIADDWTAAYYNPAGYATIADNQLGGNAAFLHLRHELNPTYRYGDIYESGILNDQINFNKYEILSNPSAGFAVRMPIFGETVVGLSAYQPFDYNINWKLYELPLAYNDTLPDPGDQYINNLDVVAFQLTVGRNYMEDKLSLGLGLQLLRADLLYSNIIFRDNIYPEPLGVRPWDKITEVSRNDGYGWGFGLKAGMLMKLNEKLNFALTASLPFDITVTGDAELDYYMPKNSTLLNNNDSTALEPGTPGYLFISGSKVVDYADFEAKLKLPASVGFGIAYTVNDKLTLAVDGEYTFWSKYEGLDFTYTNHEGLTGAADTVAMLEEFFTADVSNPVDWDNTFKAMAGVRYNVNNYLTLLGGGAFDQSPAANSEIGLTPQLVDTGDKYTLSGGFILHINQWDFGLSTSYTDFPDLNVADLVDYDDDGLYDNVNGTYRASSYETVLSFNYRF